MEPEFGDITPDDVYTEGDEDVNWDQVDELAEQIEAIQFIPDDADRLAAAKSWVAELNGVS
jgi:hypothetical protein